MFLVLNSISGVPLTQLQPGTRGATHQEYLTYLPHSGAKVSGYLQDNISWDPGYIQDTEVESPEDLQDTGVESSEYPQDTGAESLGYFQDSGVESAGYLLNTGALNLGLFQYTGAGKTEYLHYPGVGNLGHLKNTRAENLVTLQDTEAGNLGNHQDPTNPEIHQDAGTAGNTEYRSNIKAGTKDHLLETGADSGYPQDTGEDLGYLQDTGADLGYLQNTGYSQDNGAESGYLQDTGREYTVYLQDTGVWNPHQHLPQELTTLPNPRNPQWNSKQDLGPGEPQEVHPSHSVPASGDSSNLQPFPGMDWSNHDPFLSSQTQDNPKNKPKSERKTFNGIQGTFKNILGGLPGINQLPGLGGNQGQVGSQANPVPGAQAGHGLMQEYKHEEGHHEEPHHQNHHDQMYVHHHDHGDHVDHDFVDHGVHDEHTYAHESGHNGEYDDHEGEGHHYDAGHHGDPGHHEDQEHRKVHEEHIYHEPVENHFYYETESHHFKEDHQHHHHQENNHHHHLHQAHHHHDLHKHLHKNIQNIEHYQKKDFTHHNEIVHDEGVHELETVVAEVNEHHEHHSEPSGEHFKHPGPSQRSQIDSGPKGINLPTQNYQISNLNSVLPHNLTPDRIQDPDLHPEKIKPGPAHVEFRDQDYSPNRPHERGPTKHILQSNPTPTPSKPSGSEPGNLLNLFFPKPFTVFG